MKYGHTLSFINYTNTDQNFYENQILPKVNEYYKAFFDRDYYPFYTGPFIPIYITRLASRYIENVGKFYDGNSSLHSKSANLLNKIFPPAEKLSKESSEKKKSYLMEKIISAINEKHEGLLDYFTNALVDMHQIETYLSFLLVTDEKNTYSDMDYTIISIEGSIEIAVFDKDKIPYLQIAEGFYSNTGDRKPAVASVPAGIKHTLIGVPSNMEFELFLTDDTVLLTPAKVTLEHYNSAGVYKFSGSRQNIFLNMYNGCRFKIGKELLNKTEIQYESLNHRERKEYVDVADLKPEYSFRFYPEFSYGTDKNIMAGVHYGIPVFYGTALLNYNLSNWNKGFDFIAGLGNKTAFYGRYYLDVEFLGKTCFFSSRADTENKASFVPEIKLSLSRNLIWKTSSFAAFTFDFGIKDFNDDAFDDHVRKHTFGGWKINSNIKVYPSIQFGMRL